MISVWLSSDQTRGDADPIPLAHLPQTRKWKEGSYHAELLQAKIPPPANHSHSPSHAFSCAAFL